ERALALALCADPSERASALFASFPPRSQGPAETLGALVEAQDHAEFVRALALETLARKRLASLRGAVTRALEEEGATSLVRETAAFALASLDVDRRVERKDRPMLTIEKVLTLKGARMFEEASEAVLAEVAAILEEVEVGAGEAVFAKGDAGDSMYIIADGRMRVSDGERTVDELGEGEVFGELALLDPEPRLFTVAALEDGRLLRLDREAFLELMAGNIEIVRGVLHVLCERLRQAEAGVAAEGS
ncbi:MAG TPA: cyclic nucleotide-binding domain-containing protein, partial [Vicinamibacteria bacterium]